MPSPVRKIELPAAVSGTARIEKNEKARTGSGLVQFTGFLPAMPDANACVYVICDGIVYEAFCMEKDGFAVNVPADAQPQFIIYNIGGVPQMYEIQ